jgi:hypothetical protein
MSLVILILSVALLLFMLLPGNPVHSPKISAAYSRYISAPSEENKRAYEDTVNRVNRPVHIAQYTSGALGIGLLFMLRSLWRKRD